MRYKKLFMFVFILVAIPFESWASECSPLQISPPSSGNVCGLRLNLISYGHGNVTGVDLGIMGLSAGSRGIQINLVSNITDNIGKSAHYCGTKGIQVAGLVNMVFLNCDMKGIQVSSLLNLVVGDVLGLQVAFFNAGEAVAGIQIGIINFADELKGIQIGLINNIRNRDILPFMPILNIGW